MKYSSTISSKGQVTVPQEIRRSEEHTSELQSQSNLVCRLLLEKKKLQNTLTLMAAPAGFGKTMLLTSWIRTAQSTHSVAWYSLYTFDIYYIRVCAYTLESVRYT